MLCLKEPYESVLVRLRALDTRPDAVEGFGHLSIPGSFLPHHELSGRYLIQAALRKIKKHTG